MKIKSHHDLTWLPATHEDPDHPGVLKQVIFSQEDFDPDCGLRMLNFAKIAPGQAFALHLHDTLEEVFYILQGEGLIRVGDSQAKISEGMSVLIPKQTKHWLKNTGQVDLLYLAFGASRIVGETRVLE